MSTQPTSVMKRRLNAVVLSVFLIFLAWIIFNLVETSLFKNTEYQQLANSQQFRNNTINANRGAIYDKNGKILAQSTTVYTIYINPSVMQNNDEDKIDLICDKLSEILDVDKEEIREKALKPDRGYEEIKRKVDKAVADEITEFANENDIISIGRVPDTKRTYPQNDLAASVIGFTGYDGDGIYGLEKYYDEYLTGVDGRIITAMDAKGNEIPYPYEQSFEAKDGNSLILNVDSQLQYFLEKSLKKAIDTHKADNRGAGIIMNAKTGEILAMASEYDFDLNAPTVITDQKVLDELSEITDKDEYSDVEKSAWEAQWKNKAITELYFPGSVFKPITGAAALEEKVITLDHTYVCNSYVMVAGQRINCWRSQGHGTLNFVQAMTASCNPAFVEIGTRLGAEKFNDYFEAFNLSSPTGIDLPGEADSLSLDRSQYGPVELASSSFGQTNKITPLQMITAYAAVINGGYVVTPYVVDKVVDNNGNVIQDNEPQIKRQVISEETSKTMRDVLESVVTTNNGTNVYMKGFHLGGKSGTSQKIDTYNDEGRQEMRYVSSYCGFIDAEDPEIIMLVMIDEPTGKDYYGSAVAAPVVREVFEQALPYLGYFPEHSEEELKDLEVSIPNVVGSASDNSKITIESLGLKVEVVGNGEKVLKQIPSSGNAMPKGGKVILYTEEQQDEELVTVPNVVGLSVADANKALADLGLNIRPKGGAIARADAKSVEQTDLGKKVPRGTIVEVTFYINDETG